ncbi:alpha/beta hydrolase [Cryptosporangium arvum]|uniref:alpha/beta hydrolase n=1 Tax=Cryptosporangium arvum TaxID=80871 RepID=UPI00055AFFF0|nr:alpha/beta hydrolase [Cryptosporangium arvum]
MADAVVVPGRMFGPGAPLPMYAGDVAQRRGATVHRHSWSENPPVPTPASWVRAQITPLLTGVSPLTGASPLTAASPVTAAPLLIGKSLGTLAAPLAAERALPAVWLTPLLTSPEAVDALAGATAPFLLVGGTADSAWNGATARRLTPHVLEVDDADHGMYVPGPLSDSIAVLTRVTDAVDRFLATIHWP